MRKGMGLAMGVLAVAVGLGIVLSRKQEPPRPEERVSRPGRVSTGVLRPAPLPDGSLRIQGVVLGDGGPAAGVRVSATRPEAGQTLSELSCGDVLHRPDWRQRLPQCMDAAVSTVLELVTVHEGEAPMYAETSTAEDGTFTLDGLPPGSFALWAVEARGAGMWPDVAAGTEGLTLRLGAGVTLEGTVTNEDGAPLTGVRVTAVHLEHTRFFDTETDADGRYRVGPLPLALYRPVFSKEGWLPQLGEGVEHEQVVLRRPRRLVGRVLTDGHPAPGARVQAARLGEETGDELRVPPPEQETATDAQGRFTFEAMGATAYQLSATLGERHALAVVERDAFPPEVVLELGGALRVEGTVRDGAGQPVPGALVYGGPFESITDAAGHYGLGPMKPGKHRLRVTTSRYGMGSEVVESGPGTVRVDFTLESKVPIEGVVVDDAGHPVAEAVLELVQYFEDGEGETYSVAFSLADEAGRFVLDAPAPGDFGLKARTLEGRVREHLSVTAPSTDVRVVLPRKAGVSGTLTDEREAPIPGAPVTLWREAPGEGVAARDTTDARGRFSLWGLGPGRFVLEATHVSGGVERSTARPVELRANEAKQEDLRLGAGWTVSGLAVDETGAPVPGVRVYAYFPPGTEPSWRQEENTDASSLPFALTGVDGRFTLRHLQGQAVLLDVLADGHRFMPSRSSGGQPGPQRLLVPEGDAQVRLVLLRLGRIHGRLAGPDGAPITRFSLNGKDVTHPRGVFSRSVETSGTWRMELAAKGMAPVLREVEAREGEDVDLGELRMSPGRHVRGRVLDARTSEPIEGASVLATHARLPGVVIEHHRGVVSTGADGAFTLPDVEPGPLPLFVEAHGYLPRRIDLGTGDTDDVLVQLEPGASVELSVRDAQGKPMAAILYLDREGEPLTLRSYQVSASGGVQSGLEPGSYRVLAFAPGLRRGTTVFEPWHLQIPASGQVKVDLRARSSGATLELRVEDSVGFAILYPGVAPPPRLFLDFPPVEARSFPYEGVLPGDVTFRNLPPGRATLFLVERSLQGFHREELDLPAEGTVVREVTPAWRPFVFSGR